MGLDSMIYACAKKKYHDELSVGYEDIISIAEWQYEKNGINDPIEYRADGFSGEVCYWRKCWGFRDKVMDYLRGKYPEKDRDSYEWNLDIEDLQEIANYVHDYMITPDEGFSTIWTYRESLQHNATAYANLLLLIHDIEDGAISMEDIDILWVDSY